MCHFLVIASAERVGNLLENPDALRAGVDGIHVPIPRHCQLHGSVGNLLKIPYAR